MQKPECIGCVTQLTMSKVFEFEGVFYRYLYESGSIRFPQYHFRPLAGQRRRADIRMNKAKVLGRMSYVPGISVSAEVHKGYIQLTIFDLLEEAIKSQKMQMQPC